MLYNLHTHSTFSKDGRDTPETIIQTAIQENMIAIGFSDHGYGPFDASCCMTREQEPIYVDEINRLKKKYEGQIRVLLGYEHDWSEPNTDFTPYDYFIESVHWLTPGGVPVQVDNGAEGQLRSVNECYGGDWYKFCDHYFDDVCESILKTEGEIIGHITLPTKNNENDRFFSTTDPRYVNRAKEAIALAVEKGKVVEINSGAMSRGYRTRPYPDPDLIRFLFDIGGMACLGTDAHRAEWLTYGADYPLPCEVKWSEPRMKIQLPVLIKA